MTLHIERPWESIQHGATKSTPVIAEPPGSVLKNGGNGPNRKSRHGSVIQKRRQKIEEKS